nr:uncharacterized protein LOC115261990 [Aedes albopictus]
MRKASLAIPATESNCVACDRSDDADNMVQCDACDTWWHFSCAKVTASISNRAWVCSKCTKDDSLSFKSGLSDRSGSQLAESMARLKERQELEKKRLELDLQKKFLDEQQRLLDATVTAVSGSLKSCVTRRESTQRVEEWICRTAEQKAFEESDREPVDPSRLQLVQGLAVTERYGAPIEMMRHVQKRSESDTDELQKLQRQMEECQKKIAVLKITAQSDYPSAAIMKIGVINSYAIVMEPDSSVPTGHSSIVGLMTSSGNGNMSISQPMGSSVMIAHPMRPQ